MSAAEGEGFVGAATTLSGVTSTEWVYQAAWSRSPIPSAILDSAGRVIDLNRAYLEMSGRTRDEMIGASTIELIHADDLPGVVFGLDQLMSGVDVVRQSRRHKRADGSWIRIDAATRLLPYPSGDGSYVVVVEILDHQPDAVDVDLHTELIARQVYQPAGDAACIHDPYGRVAFASPSLDTLLGRPQGWMIGRRLTDTELDPVLADGSPCDSDQNPLVDPACAAFASGEEEAVTLGVSAADGSRRWLAVVAGPVGRAALPVRSSLRDITELVETQQEAQRLAALVEEQLAYRANHDDLTGLTARRIVLGQLDEELKAGRTMSVVFVDLDGFKAINDELGHLAGDDLLVGVADRLRELRSPSITVGRAGGDEFVAVTPSADHAEEFAARVRAAVADPEGLVPGSSRRVGASVGVAHSEAGDDRSSLLARADRSMYELKRAARAAARAALDG